MELQRKVMCVVEGLHRVLDLIYHFRSVTTAWQHDSRIGAAADLSAISVFCNSKMADLYGRAAYGAPGAVAALSTLAPGTAFCSFISRSVASETVWQSSVRCLMHNRLPGRPDPEAADRAAAVPGLSKALGRLAYQAARQRAR